ncbi:MAG: hypothetical protein K0A98_16620 [Trueperaceae bacterium]|nr:hypothetical protein [Trueperaceae bacterium]
MDTTSKGARRSRNRFAVLVVAAAMAWAWAQPAAEAPTGELPVRHLVLFTNGVGYFEHAGTVVGTQEIELPVAPEHMDDLLQSLVVQDLGGGRVEAVRYGARDPLGRVLSSYALDLSGDPTLAQLLAQARGEAVRIEAGETLRGVIVNVERVNVPDQAPRTLLTLATDAGLQRIDLDEVRAVAFEREALQAELDAALAAIARYRGGDAASVRLRFVGEGEREVRVAYVREMPVWKASYRLALEEPGRAELQGWAILDNPTALDLEDVSVWFVAGQPISFVASLYAPVYVDRPRVDVATAPVLDPVADAGQFAPMAAEAARSMMAPSPAMMADALESAAPGFGGEGVEAAAEGVAGGATFAYRVSEPVTVGRFESAMIPIVVATVEAHAVSWYDADVLRDHPLRAVRLVNDSGLHLAAGPVTVFDEGGFAGQALLADVVPDDSRMLAYAVDLDLRVSVASASEPERVVSAVLRGSVLETSWRSVLTTRYRLEPRGDGERFVVVEHPQRAGFAVVSPAGPVETGDAWRFGVEIGAGAPADPTVPAHLRCADDACVLSVVMERLDGRRTAVANVGGDQIAFYLENVDLSDADREALEAVLELQRTMAELDRQVVALEAQVNEVFRDQSRIRDNMAALERSSSLYRRYLADLEAQENLLTELREAIADRRNERAEAQRELDELIEELAAAAGG